MELQTPRALTEKQVNDFQEITKKLYGIELSREEAEKEGLELIEFLAAVLEDDS